MGNEGFVVFQVRLKIADGLRQRHVVGRSKGADQWRRLRKNSTMASSGRDGGRSPGFPAQRESVIALKARASFTNAAGSVAPNGFRR
jgi:hypothetical protein